MYTVVGGLRSRAFRVLWLLEELGLEYEHIAAGPQSDEALLHNPTGKIPVLLADGKAIADSVAIMTFLADRHGGFTHPAGSLERARQDAMTNRVLDEFDAVLWTAARHSFGLPEDRRVPDVKVSLRWEFARNAATLARDMGEAEFAFGDSPTVADILLTHCLNWARGAKFEHEAPALDAYAKRMRAREAFKRTMAIGG